VVASVESAKSAYQSPTYEQSQEEAFGVVPNNREFLAEHYVKVFENQSSDFLISPKKSGKSRRWNLVGTNG